MLDIPPGRAIPPAAALNLGPYAELVVQLRRVLAGHPAVQAMWLHGSRVTGRAAPGSGLDLSVVCAPDARAAALAALAPLLDRRRDFVDYLTDARVDLWRWRGREVRLQLDDEAGFRDRVTTATATVDGLDAGQGFLQHVVLEAGEADDPSDLLGWARARLAALPDALWHDLATRYLRRVGRKLEWWRIRDRWRSPYEAMADLAVVIDELVRVHYAVNRRCFRTGMKAYPHDRATLSPALDLDPLLDASLTDSVRRDAATAAARALYRTCALRLGAPAACDELTFLARVALAPGDD